MNGPWLGVLADIDGIPALDIEDYEAAAELLADEMDNLGNPPRPSVQRAVAIIRLRKTERLRAQARRILGCL